MSDLNTADQPAEPVAEVERHASWDELFFDLVAVAGVAALAHVLVTELDLASLGLYAVLFLAFWLSWTAFMLYGNVAAGQTHVVRLMVGMFGLGVMAASVPGVTHAVLQDGHDVRPLTVFTAAYVATRVYGGQSWRRGEVLLDFPVVQQSVGVLPWVVSFWVDEPWKVAFWAVGVGVDLLLILVVSGDEMLQQVQARFTTRAKQVAGQRKRTPDASHDDDRPVIRGVSVDPAHLAERLGLFVIIVLGESVVQVVNAASEATYDRGLLTSGLASFVLLAGMFGLSVVYGYAGLPHLRAGSLPTRAALGLHCLATGVIATVAVALASVVEHGAEPLPGPSRWLLCGAVATYFTLGLVASIASHGFHLAPVAVWVTTGIAVPLLLGLLAADAGGRALVSYVALVLLVHLWFERRSARARTGGTAPLPAL